MSVGKSLCVIAAGIIAVGIGISGSLVSSVGADDHKPVAPFRTKFVLVETEKSQTVMTEADIRPIAGRAFLTGMQYGKTGLISDARVWVPVDQILRIEETNDDIVIQKLFGN